MRHLGATMVGLLLAALVGASWAAEGEKGEPVELVGVLKAVMAIGAETTGFVIEVEKGGAQEVSGDPKVLEKFLDKKVRARGTYYEKVYVERGRVRILKIEQIDLAR
jgi:hypothetical protein